MNQSLLRLTQTITVERGHSLISIPDGTTADYELYQLKISPATPRPAAFSDPPRLRQGAVTRTLARRRAFGGCRRISGATVIPSF